MDYYSGYINKLIEQLSRLPGIGTKTAQRLAFHIMSMPEEQARQLASSITEAKEHVRYCKCCQTLTDSELCPICRDAKRNQKQIMVVEHTQDLAAYEKTGRYEGVYHVLHGAISPMLGIGPDDIRLKELMQRLQGGCGGSDRGNQLQPGGRDDRHVYQQTDQAHRYPCDTDCQRRSGWGRPGKYR